MSEELTYHSIDANFRNAAVIRDLIYQDKMLAGYPKLATNLELINPRRYFQQWARLDRHADRYHGAFMGSSEYSPLVGFMKYNQWRVFDQLPYAVDEEEVETLNDLASKNHHQLEPPTYGIFGLVALDSLPEALQEEVAYTFIHKALATAAFYNGDDSMVNIVIHEHDPVLSVATEMGFQGTGRWGEPAGAPGLKQQLYQRSAVK